MKLKINIKNTDLPVEITEEERIKSILLSIAESKDGTLNYNRKDVINLTEKFDDISSVVLTFE